MRILFFLLVIFISSYSLPTNADETIVVYTENYPPFNYQDETGNIVGGSTANVRQVLDHAGIDYVIRLVPWSRALARVKQSDTALIYTITRIPLRENEFQWLAPLAPSDFRVYARSSDMRTYTRELLASGAVTAACVKDDLTCELLKILGLPEHKIRTIAGSISGDYRLVMVQRADVYISEKSVNERLRTLAGEDVSSTKSVMNVDVKAGFYLAGSAYLRADLRDRIVAAYEDLKSKGIYGMYDVMPSDESSK